MARIIARHWAGRRTKLTGRCGRSTLRRDARRSGAPARTAGRAKRLRSGHSAQARTAGWAKRRRSGSERASGGPSPHDRPAARSKSGTRLSAAALLRWLVPPRSRRSARRATGPAGGPTGERAAENGAFRRRMVRIAVLGASDRPIRVAQPTLGPPGGPDAAELSRAAPARGPTPRAPLAGSSPTRFRRTSRSP